MCEKGKIDMIVGKMGQVGRVREIVDNICEVVDEMHEIVMWTNRGQGGWYGGEDSGTDG